MPRKPKKPCRYPGCPKLTYTRYCPEHERLASQQYEKYDRDPAAKRRYGRAWRKIRARFLAGHPLCTKCQQEIPFLKLGNNSITIGKVQGEKKKISGYNLYKYTAPEDGILDVTANSNGRKARPSVFISAPIAALVEGIERDIGPIEVMVFNIGANVPCSILDETARKYFKIWEMACFSGFLTSQAVASSAPPPSQRASAPVEVRASP